MSELPSGTFGVVLPYQLKTNKNNEKNNHVTKIFFDKYKYDELIRKQALINEIFKGDPNYKTYPYKKTPLLFSNILKIHGQTINESGIIRNRSGAVVDNSNYKKVLNLYSKAHKNNSDENNSDENKAHENTMYAIHMPYLGVDFEHIKDIIDQLRAIPVHDMLVNVRELLGKTSLLWNDDRRYIHGDIRSSNMMIRPTTGKMTLIDFDWLDTVNEFVKEYPFKPMFPHIPPELIVIFVIKNKKSLKGESFSIDNLKLTEDEMEKMESLIKNKPYRTLTDNCSAYSFKIFTYLGVLYDKEDAFKEAVNNAIDDSFDDSFDVWKTSSPMGTFDGYGVGQNLLELFHLVYPRSVTRNRLEQDATPDMKAIDEMVHDVLMPLCALRLHDRQHVGELLVVADAIIAKLEHERKVHNVSNQRNKRNGGTRNKRKRSKRTRKQRK